MLVVGSVLLVVVGGRGRTTTAQERVVRMVEWEEVLEGRATGLVPGFAAYPSSTTVESERGKGDGGGEGGCDPPVR